ncbi:MAG: GxxExxY protein [Bacteroidota bacterium]
MKREGELLYKEEVYSIVGAAIEVHKNLGPGYVEAIYQEAFEIELGLQDIPFNAESLLSVIYKGILLKKKYIPDFLCYGKIIVELKACKSLDEWAEAQILNYLKASGIRVGLLINFGSVGKLEWKRFVY